MDAEQRFAEVFTRGVEAVTRVKKKDSLAWLEELVEAAKAWRTTLVGDPVPGVEVEELTPHNRNTYALATAVDGYRQAIKRGNRR